MLHRRAYRSLIALKRNILFRTRTRPSYYRVDIMDYSVPFSSLFGPPYNGSAGTKDDPPPTFSKMTFFGKSCLHYAQVNLHSENLDSLIDGKSFLFSRPGYKILSFLYWSLCCERTKQQTIFRKRETSSPRKWKQSAYVFLSEFFFFLSSEHGIIVGFIQLEEIMQHYLNNEPFFTFSPLLISTIYILGCNSSLDVCSDVVFKI